MLAPMVVRWGGFQFGAQYLMKAVCFRVCGRRCEALFRQKNKQKRKRLDKHRTDQKSVTVGEKKRIDDDNGDDDKDNDDNNNSKINREHRNTESEIRCGIFLG